MGPRSTKSLADESPELADTPARYVICSVEGARFGARDFGGLAEPIDILTGFRRAQKSVAAAARAGRHIVGHA